MKYDNLRAFEKYLEGVNPQKFSPLYFILGIDHFECQEAINLLLRTLLPEPGQKELSLTQLDGSQVDEQGVGNALHSKFYFQKCESSGFSRQTN